jgi:hypothetical protein
MITKDSSNCDVMCWFSEMLLSFVTTLQDDTRDSSNCDVMCWFSEMLLSFVTTLQDDYKR